MEDLLEHRLLVVTGKGGVGKTTIAAALGLAAAARGRRALVVEMGEQSRLAGLFERRAAAPGETMRLEPGLDSLTIDPDLALLEWLQQLGGRVSGRILASSGTFQYFAAAAPGARELVSMIKLNRLVNARERRGRGSGRGFRYDVVILDAPASGHALGLLRSPQTFGAIARVGPIVRHTSDVAELLADAQRSAFVGVAMGTEMAVTEVIELEDGLREALGRGLFGVLVNGLLPRRFSAGDLQTLDAASAAHPSEPALAAAARAARLAHGRSAVQHGQLARLRRRGFDVLPVPFQWVAQLDLAAIRVLADGLARRL